VVKLDKKQKIIMYSFILAIVWSYSITVFAENVSVVPFYVQFMLVSAIAYTFPSLILGQSFLEHAKKKIFATWLFLMSCDLVFPPLVVNLDGSTTNILLGQASPDYFFSQIWSAIGLSGPVLFLVTYPVTFFILMMISIRLLSTRQLRELA